MIGGWWTKEINAAIDSVRKENSLAAEMFAFQAKSYDGLREALVIGNGPSTKELDFAHVKNLPLITVGMNAAYRFWYKIDFRPTHYICMDTVLILSHAEAIRELVLEGRIQKFFLRDEIKSIYPELADHKNILWYADARKDVIFTTNFVTTGSWAIRWMANEGAKCVGIIGIDANYVELLPAARRIDGESPTELVISQPVTSNPNYFFDDYQQVGDKYNIPNDPNYVKETGRLVHVDAVSRARDDISGIYPEVTLCDLSNVSTHKIFAKKPLNAYLKSLESVIVTSFHANIEDCTFEENIITACVNSICPEVSLTKILFEGAPQQFFPRIKRSVKTALELLMDAGRLKIDFVDKRPSYTDLFSSTSSAAGTAIVANSDIIIPAATLRKAKSILSRDCERVLALTRWNVVDGGRFLQGLESSPPWRRLDFKELTVWSRNYFSFDTYMVKLPFDLPAAFKQIYLGTFGCDTALSAVLKLRGHFVQNPCLELFTYHFDEKVREYNSETGKKQLLSNIAACRDSALERYELNNDALEALGRADALRRNSAWLGHHGSIDFWHALFRALGASPWTHLEERIPLNFISIRLNAADIERGAWDKNIVINAFTNGIPFLKWELEGTSDQVHVFDLLRRHSQYTEILPMIEKYQYQSFINYDTTDYTLQLLHKRLLALFTELLQNSMAPYANPEARSARFLKPVGLQFFGAANVQDGIIALAPPHKNNSVAQTFIGGIRQGDTISGVISVELETAAKLSLMICRNGIGEFEASNLDLALGPGFHAVPLQHVFRSRQSGFRVQIGAIDVSTKLKRFSFEMNLEGGFELASAEHPEPPQHFVVSLDPDGVDQWGHFLSYNLRVGEAAHVNGLEYALLAREDTRVEALEPFGVIVKKLTSHSWSIGNTLNPNTAEIDLFRRQILSGVDALRLSGKDSFILYFYCGSIHHLIALDRVASAETRVCCNVNLFWTSFVDYRSPAYVERWRPILVRALQNRALKITVPTRAVQAGIQASFGLNIPVAPHPSTTFSDEDAKAPVRLSSGIARAETVLFPGGARVEKGFLRTIEVVAAMREQLPTVRCIMRAAKLDAVENVRDTLLDLSFRGVRFESGEMDNDQFVEFLRQADVIVLPYTGKAFAERTSGLLIDALLLGIPCVVVKDTWLADIVSEYRIGVVVDDSASSILQGIHTVLTHRDDYLSVMDAARKKYMLENSWESLICSVLEVGESSLRDVSSRNLPFRRFSALIKDQNSSSEELKLSPPHTRDTQKREADLCEGEIVSFSSVANGTIGYSSPSLAARDFKNLLIRISGQMLIDSNRARLALAQDGDLAKLISSALDAVGDNDVYATHYHRVRRFVDRKPLR